MSRSADVRMSGFRSRSTVNEALAWIDQSAQLLNRIEILPLQFACQRILAQELVASIDVPEFDRSAMDGYALRAAETVAAGDYNPLTFHLIGEALPGRPWSGLLSSGETVRIMTGAPVPQGADAVVPAEYATAHGPTIQITMAVSPGKNVGRRGEDITTGTIVLPRFRVLRPQDLAVVASLGFPELPVVARPAVRILITGNELVTPGRVKEPFQIYESNSYQLRSLVERDFGKVESVQFCRDDADSIRSALMEPGADVVLISGGSSVGQEDWAPLLVRELGELPIHGVAMRPSSPAGIGRIGSCFVCLLPGNPVSCLCAYDFFAGRIIRLLGGRSPDWPYPVRTVPLTRKVSSAVGRLDYCRVRLTDHGAEPLAISGASILSSTTRADGFLIIDMDSEGLPAGATVPVYLYDT